MERQWRPSLAVRFPLYRRVELTNAAQNRSCFPSLRWFDSMPSKDVGDSGVSAACSQHCSSPRLPGIAECHNAQNQRERKRKRMPLTSRDVPGGLVECAIFPACALVLLVLGQEYNALCKAGMSLFVRLESGGRRQLARKRGRFGDREANALGELV